MPRSFLTRRRFTFALMGAGGAMLMSPRLPAAEFQLRQFHNQPPESPLHKRLLEMWAAVKTETNGRVDVQTFSENDHIAGGDPAALKMIVDGSLDFFTLNGGLIGSVVPAMNVQSIAFAFRDTKQVFAALDGDLGDYLRQEMSAKGIYALPKACFDNGFQQLTCQTKPIRNAVDLQGVKVRTPDSPVYIELFKALGATPVPINIDKLYESLKSGIVEAQTDPLTIIELFKLYEVQKYLSLTSHVWGGFNMIASQKTWQKLPADMQRVIERNAVKYVQLQRADNQALNDSLRSKLTEQGMIFNEADTSSFRARLGPFYARWKETVGQRAWSLLEAHAGKLG
jgi:tripartite ATP-independent transporter DctP family solute receptor